jgi:hypothetical protein
MRYTWCLVVGIGMICFERAAAWNDSGHRAIARWAWRELPDRERAYFSKLLSHHPHYTIYLMAEKPETVSEVEWGIYSSGHLGRLATRTAKPIAIGIGSTADPGRIP